MCTHAAKFDKQQTTIGSLCTAVRSRSVYSSSVLQNQGHLSRGGGRGGNVVDVVVVTQVISNGIVQTGYMYDLPLPNESKER